MVQVAIVSRLRNSVLQRALTKAGSGTALAAALGLTPSQISAWGGLKEMPGVKWQRMHWERVGMALATLLGRWYDFEEVFPADLYAAVGSGGVPRRIEKHVEVEPLSLTGMAPSALLCETNPEMDVIAKGKGEAIARAMKRLTPREGMVISMRFGFDGEEKTLEAVGEVLNISRERARLIEAKALRKLRKNRGFCRSIGEVPPSP